MKALPPVPMLQACRWGNFEGAWRVANLTRGQGMAPDGALLPQETGLRSTGDGRDRVRGAGGKHTTSNALVLGACEAGRVGVAVGPLHVHMIKAMMSRGWSAQVVELVRAFDGNRLWSHRLLKRVGDPISRIFVWLVVLFI